MSLGSFALDLGPRGRAALCAVFFGGEALLIATAGMRTDRSYGFRMFPETSSVTVHLSRRLDGGKLVPVEGNRWQARDCGGGVHGFAWGKLVRFPAPGKLDARVGAPYGVESEVARTHDAMVYVARNTPEDCETRALVAHVERVRNGRELEPVDVEVPRDPR
jgi:hypothetical protein